MAAGDLVEGSVREGAAEGDSVRRGGGAAADHSGSDRGKRVASDGGGGGSNSAAAGDRVENLMARLRLTAAENAAVVIDDVDDQELVDPDRTFWGKVLSPSVLHLETIKSAMRPAWGNPCGLTFNPAGDNLFVAEFGSKADRDRVMEGSPWKVGKHAVLLKKVDADASPVDAVFDRLAIWARILKLPTRLMRADRGLEIARPIGIVKRVEADSIGRCWGPYMRVRVEIDVNEPLLRFVTVTSSKLQSSTAYEVQYERLPLYCFSCGLLGHSTLVCTSPAERDEHGDLPYTAKRLSAEDNSKIHAGTTSSNVASGGNSVPGSRGSDGSSVQGGRGRGAGRGANHGEEQEGESHDKKFRAAVIAKPRSGGQSLCSGPPERGSAPEGFSIDTAAISAAIFITAAAPMRRE
ncbi:hypothetical protein QYE76_038950 [Lolium multiflorum]|uniref:DUF4283 domain-containing protein n=1 Tax=Lolium multiflorum TaxID=4521 RepID=A0AAD8T9W5_LOLMU|nr:hypothetical protein QYE76_038950 [Lolium multiflorum]